MNWPPDTSMRCALTQRFSSDKSEAMAGPTSRLFHRLFHPSFVSKKPRSNIRDRVLIEGLVQGLGAIAYMRCRQNVLEMAERMLGRQWLKIEYVDSGTGDFPSFQRLNERCFIDDGTA